MSTITAGSHGHDECSVPRCSCSNHTQFMARAIATLGILICALVGSPLHAGVLFTFSEVGGNVVAQTSGTIASGWGGVNHTYTQTYGADRGVLAFDSLRAEVAGAKRYYNLNGGWTKNNNISNAILSTGGEVAGDAFGYAGSQSLILPAAVSIGDAFTPDTTITWTGETFASLGLDTSLSTTPLVLFTLDNGSTISAALNGAPAVPGPGVAGLATIGLAGISRRRRR